MSKLDDPNNPDPGGDPLGENPPAGAAGDDSAPPSNTDLQEWRRRALEAEALVDQLGAEIESLRAQLESTSRSSEITRLLERAGAIDLDAAKAVLESRLSRHESEGPIDLDAAIDDLRRALPFLFASTDNSAAPAPSARARSAMTAATNHADRAFDDLDAALELASTTGDRAALLRYLRLRRAV